MEIRWGKIISLSLEEVGIAGFFHDHFSLCFHRAELLAET